VQPLAVQRGCVAKNGGSLQIDDLDRQIVAELVRNARQSYAAIGERIGLSASAVKRRTDRLCRDGAVVGFSAVLNPEAAGETEAFVELYCQQPIAPESIARVLERHPQVMAAYIVSGEPDALVHLRTGTVAELDEVLEQIRSELRAERSRSSIVLAQLLQRSPSL
jgi:DNA-binding Lrp family transcriptional regulator